MQPTSARAALEPLDVAKFESVIERFESSWQSGERPDLATLAPIESPDRIALITELVRIEWEFRLKAGESVTLSEYQSRFPELLNETSLWNSLQAVQQRWVVRTGPSITATKSEASTVVEPAMLPPTRLGDYELLHEIARGGMGVVYKARHVRLKKTVALKVLPNDRLHNTEAVSRFHREMEAIGQLRHPNVIEAYDAGEENGQHYLAVEYVDGLDLARLVQRFRASVLAKTTPEQQTEPTIIAKAETHSNLENSGMRDPISAVLDSFPAGISVGLPVPDACELIRQAAIGLQHAHDSGLVHRDIKPSNLLLSTAGLVKVLDLGLARLHSEQPLHDLTSTGQVMGTVDYMSPEQISDSRDTDARADLYSLGCTLYFLLAGQPPFAGPTYGSAYQKMKAHESTAPLAIGRTDIPIGVQAVLARLLNKQPADRFDSAQDVAAALVPFTTACDLVRLLKTAKGELPPEALVSRKERALQADQPKPGVGRLASNSPTPPVTVANPVTSGDNDNRRGFRKLLAAASGAAALFVLLGVIVITITKPDGTQSKVTVPVGTTIDVQASPGSKVSITVKDDSSTPASKPSPDPSKKPLGFEVPGFDQWVQEVSAMPAEQQVKAVAKKLQELNPEFNGEISPRFRDSKVVHLYFLADNITDLSPLRALNGLEHLHCASAGIGKSRLSDLSPLIGLPLKELIIPNAAVADLTPLKNVPLRQLGIDGANVSDLSPLRGMKLVTLNIQFTNVVDLSPLIGMQLATLHASKAKVADLLPLKNMPLKTLFIEYTGVADLSPLKGMQLITLKIASTKVTDISALKGMPLTHLELDGLPVTDLSMLQVMPLKYLSFVDTDISNLSPLEGMSLERVSFTPKNISQGIAVLRQMNTLKTIAVSGHIQEQFTPEEFWKKHDAGDFGDKQLAFQTRGFDQWVNDISALPAAQQVEAVSKKLRELNPGFDGTINPKYRNGTVVALDYVIADNIEDLSPLRALKELETLHCAATEGKSRLSDLSPLIGLPLTTILIPNAAVADLTPLKDMKLVYLHAPATKIVDLSPLKNMPLTRLMIDATNVSDLSAVMGKKLTGLGIGATKVTDLSPIKGMPLEELSITGLRVESGLSDLLAMPLKQLNISHSNVTDLGPFSGGVLTELRMHKTFVSDLTPVKDSPLKQLTLDFNPSWDTALLRSIGTLETINGKPASEFFQAIEAYNAAALKPRAFKTPGFDRWLKQVTGLPAVELVKAVSLKLQELNPGFDGTVKPIIHANIVTRLEFLCDNVTDVSPTRACAELDILELRCSVGDPQGGLSDLSPLQGMRLRELYIVHTHVSDLSPLRGMKLSELSCVSSLVTDLSPLKEMPLKSLDIRHSPVSDLSSLKGMPLTYLAISTTRISDLSLLKDMQLEHLLFDVKSTVDAEMLHSITSLITINNKPAAEFWMEVGQGQRTKEPLVFATLGFDQWVRDVSSMPAEQQVKAVGKKLQELNPGFDGEVRSRIDNAVVVELGFSADNVTDISPVRALSELKNLNCVGSDFKKCRFSDLSPLRGMKLTTFNCSNTEVTTLKPLTGMSLTHLSMNGTKVDDLSLLKDMPLVRLEIGLTPVSDLSPLKGMSLNFLSMEYTPVIDFSPLTGMPLEYLTILNTQLADLSPLTGMPLNGLSLRRTLVTDLLPIKGLPLRTLRLNETFVSDLSPLKDMPLEKLYLDFKPYRDTELLRSIKTLETINDKPAAEFCNAVEAYKAKTKEPLAFQTPGFDGWVKEVASMPAEMQVEAVSKKLLELNPGFDGNVTPTIENGAVIGLIFSIGNVMDISPVRACVRLKWLSCNVYGRPTLADFSPLAGMQLTDLVMNGTQVADLSPLKGMKLKVLCCVGANIADLAPLKGMPLVHLNLTNNPVSDLSPLKGMPLSESIIEFTLVTDLSPFMGMSLSDINCASTQVSDLSPLEGMPLTRLSLTPQKITKGIDAIRQMKTLKTIGLSLKSSPATDFPTADFWKKYDAGEFGKPATSKRLFFQTPGFEPWAKRVAAMPAEKQVEAVSKKLQELNPGFNGVINPTISNGSVVGLDFIAYDITDISPVRALGGLLNLDFHGTSDTKSQLSNLSPLMGMSLKSLIIHYTDVADLSPLKDMPLESLRAAATKILDLSPLKNVPLKKLAIEDTGVSDLSPLEGKRLTLLKIASTKVTDISALKGMALTWLELDVLPVADLSVLKGMPLKYLSLTSTNVSDVSPLGGMSLETVIFAPNNISQGIAVLRQMNTLQTIAISGHIHEQFTPEEFWKKYDAGEFGHPTP